MLKTFPAGADLETPPAVIWLDLHDPTPAELAEAERIVGAPMPTRAGLSEIETSSRLRSREGVLSMSMPTVTHDPGGPAEVLPVGFVLSQSHLVTIRFGRLRAAEALAARFEAGTNAPTCSLDAFVGLCDDIVDVLADVLEQIAGELKTISTTLFRTKYTEGPEAVRSNRMISVQLRQVGRLGDQASEARDALLGVGRVVDFACELTGSWAEGRFEPSLRSLRQDVASLDDYQVHLDDKVQFLLDAMVGLIGMAQNDIFKVLTIVSIVGIPPTLMAGVYGMNFHYMPELAWAWGYPYGLAVIALSAIIPLAWFKLRGWF
ncbi:MAG TPA: magnesium transporter CorA family protein [Caulobacteraceae bacterium]